MAKPKNLNEKNSEYIESNFLSADPEGLPPMSALPKDGDIVIATHIPEIRRIQFINGRDPGQELMFHFHSKTHPLKHYTLFHGQEYDLPVEIIDHLENCAQAQYGYKQGHDGRPEMYTKSYKYNFRCQKAKQRAA